MGIGGAMILVWRKRSRGYFKYSGQNFALVVMVGINILYGFTNQGIDNYAHMGGVIGGYLSAYLTGFRGSSIKAGQRVAAVIGILLLAAVGIAAGFVIWGGKVGY